MGNSFCVDLFSSAAALREIARCHLHTSATVNVQFIQKTEKIAIVLPQTFIDTCPLTSTQRMIRKFPRKWLQHH
jgi:hypothetical protein